MLNDFTEMSFTRLLVAYGYIRILQQVMNAFLQFIPPTKIINPAHMSCQFTHIILAKQDSPRLRLLTTGPFVVCDTRTRINKYFLKKA